MTQTAINYAVVLFQLQIPKADLAQTADAFLQVPQLGQALQNPTISLDQKHRLIEKIFPQSTQHFLKVLCDHQSVGEIRDIWDAYCAYCRTRENKISATLYYVTKPDAVQQEKMKTFLCRKYNKAGVDLTLVEKPELLGGFILSAENREYDWSLQGRLAHMKSHLEVSE